MELKLNKFNSIRANLESLNRTFMELKHKDLEDLYDRGGVLIEPLWN